MAVELYNYKATLVRVLDGDTIEAKMDLGFGISVDTILRLDGIDTPEKHSTNAEEVKAANIARALLEHMIINQPLILKTVKYEDKYGRYLAQIYVANFITNKLELINDQMVQKGLAHKYDGGTKQPWTAEEFKNINEMNTDIY